MQLCDTLYAHQSNLFPFHLSESLSPFQYYVNSTTSTEFNIHIFQVTPLKKHRATLPRTFLD